MTQREFLTKVIATTNEVEVREYAEKQLVKLDERNAKRSSTLNKDQKENLVHKEHILEFLKALPVCAKEKGIIFSTPTEIVTKLKSVDQVDVPYPLSWVDEERDISCWLGNTMQREAFNKLYSVAERVHLCTDRRIKQDWDYMQASNNFRFMTTKNTGVWLNRGIYDSPFDAFTNYMNILGDFISRVNSLYPVDMDNEELNSLLTTIRNQGQEIEILQKELDKYKKKAEKATKKTAK